MKNIFLIILALIISIVSINWISSVVNFSKVISVLKNINLIEILILFTIFFISFYIRAIRFYFLQQKIAKTNINLVNQSFSINYIINIFLPLRFGEIFRILYLKKKQKISVFDSMFIISLEKFNDIIAITFFLFIIIYNYQFTELYNWIFPEVLPQSKNILFLFLLFLGFLILSTVFLINKNLKNKIISKILFYKDLLLSIKLVSLAFFLTILSWSLEASLFIVCAFFLKIEGYFILGLLSVCLVALGTSIPSAPSSIGIFEGSVVLSSIILSLNTSDALSLAIVVHIIQILTILLFTMLAFLLPISPTYLKKLLF